jgi:hypothetical protein
VVGWTYTFLDWGVVIFLALDIVVISVILQMPDRHITRPLPTYLPTYGSTALLLDLGGFFSFLILYTVGRIPWTGDQPVARPLSTHRTTQTPNKRTQTSMPRVGFELTIPAFERAKTVHALNRAATVIGTQDHYLYNIT